jgi:diguanylate cyclase (GGDEF)-like protein
MAIDQKTLLFSLVIINALMAARRSAFPVAFMMIDVDHFKRINDTHGHPVGDEVLRRIARLLAARLRRCDVLGRDGGEEFCVIAPETGLEGARALAESLRETVAATPVVREWGQVATTISVGLCVARAGPGALSLEEILANADAALYVAKQGGRNRVAVCAHCRPADAAGDGEVAARAPARTEPATS